MGYIEVELVCTFVLCVYDLPSPVENPRRRNAEEEHKNSGENARHTHSISTSVTDRESRLE